MTLVVFEPFSIFMKDSWFIIEFFRERFPRLRLQRNPLVSDPGMHHDKSVMHVGIAIPGGGERVPGIPGACTTRNFATLRKFRMVYLYTLIMTCRVYISLLNGAFVLFKFRRFLSRTWRWCSRLHDRRHLCPGKILLWNWYRNSSN